MRNSCTFKLATAVTFRRASSKILQEKNKKNIGWGSNMQNIEDGLRQIYVPDGFKSDMIERLNYYLDNDYDTSVFTEEELLTIRVFLQSDQAGAEGKLVAFDCPDRDYRALFKCGISPHVYTALKLFAEDWKKKIVKHNIPIDPSCVDVLKETPIRLLKKNPDWGQLSALIKLSDSWNLTERFYYFAKQTVHSFSYGIQWFTFLMNLLEKSGGKVVLSREQAEYFLSGIRSYFPEVPERNRRIDDQVRSTGMVFNCHGQPYTIWPGGSPPSYMLTDMKKYYAWGPQSGVAGITQIALTRFQEYVEKTEKKWDVLQETHDSFLTQGLLHDTRERYLKMKECIEEQEFTSSIDGEKYRMASETKVGFNWSGKDELNKLGLRVYKLL